MDGFNGRNLNGTSKNKDYEKGLSATKIVTGVSCGLFICMIIFCVLVLSFFGRYFEGSGYAGLLIIIPIALFIGGIAFYVGIISLLPPIIGLFLVILHKGEKKKGDIIFFAVFLAVTVAGLFFLKSGML